MTAAVGSPAAAPLPDVQAVVFHLASLAACAAGEASPGAAAACAPAAALFPGVAELVSRLRLARVRVAALLSADAGGTTRAAEHACLAALNAADDDGAADVEALCVAAGGRVTTLDQAAQRWRLAPGAVAVVGGTASVDDLLSPALAAGFRPVLLSNDGGVPSLPHAARAADVPRALAAPSDVVAGLFLTPRRCRALLRGRLLHPLPRRGAVALPVDAAAPLEPQGPWHVLLHKATDTLAPDARPGALTFAPEVNALAAYAQAHPATALLEPLHALDVIFDRGATCALLARMPEALRGGGGSEHAPLGAPAFALVDSFEGDALSAALEGAGVALPCLLKSRVACGASGAHAMALLMRPAGAARARVPLPALAQAFVRHAGRVVHKIYVIGDALFTTTRPSLPPPPHALAAADAALPAALPFDALSALPRAWLVSGTPAAAAAEAGAGSSSEENEEAPPLDMAAARAAADWLRTATGLRLFGFDVVIERDTKRHCIVDLNYFPSCANVAGAGDALAVLLAAAVRENAAQHASPSATS